ncbi:hypothetical protein CANCADRAFT_3368 [Tortispora caseinolytica NRRL Y-17796]|uniref:tRNA-5-taurinomethyluridine 2-sulfurtransferase n=1 Tax=Tortispora caseinolytica NRRL Y-17796 TaxID=767744 RepID=A0A1E4TAH0_9ASCO|nr:hypothetical protein CANCADRAFT_3368 [Tortispora caseinolytica NRRL Y-17796]
MSSGVDSSVVAAQLAQQHSDVRGIYMANWGDSPVVGSKEPGCTEREWADVQAVCAQLQIPAERINLEKQYWARVFQPMIDAYADGRTPNPDVACNAHIKFGILADNLRARASTGDIWLATGHYARIMHDPTSNAIVLMTAIDTTKDQSFFLSTVPSKSLANVLFPLGSTTKKHTRQIANELGLKTAQNPDSQGLCFVGESYSDFSQFLADYIADRPGPIIAHRDDGSVRLAGDHLGIWNYTIGQRARVHMHQADPLETGTWFVSRKDANLNTIHIVRGHDNPELFSDQLSMTLQNILEVPDVLALPRIRARISSMGPFHDVATVDRDASDSLTIQFQQPVRAVAPGQICVLYSDDIVIAAGEITSSTSSI